MGRDWLHRLPPKVQRRFPRVGAGDRRLPFPVFDYDQLFSIRKLNPVVSVGHGPGPFRWEPASNPAKDADIYSPPSTLICQVVGSADKASAFLGSGRRGRAGRVLAAAGLLDELRIVARRARAPGHRTESRVRC